MKIINKLLALALLLVIITFSACSDDDEPLPAMGVAFQTTSLGISESTLCVDVIISFSRATTVENTITLSLEEQGVILGQNYTVNPAPTGNQLQLVVPSGVESASFTVSRTSDIIPTGSSLNFIITAVTGEAQTQISGNTSIDIGFEAIASAGSDILASTGGGTQPNQLFIDFSLNNQTSASRVSWDLGFFSGSEDKVILNYSTYMLARALDKTDLNNVSSADTVGFGAETTIGTAGADIYVDSPDRDLEKLAISDISSVDGDNKVYIINRGSGPGSSEPEPGSADVGSTPRGWKKVRILKNGDDYVIQHADIDATSFSETTVSKDADFNFVYFSFEDGANISVEPKKALWDIQMTVSSNIIDFGAGDGAYGFSDFSLSNRQGGVEVAAIGPVRGFFGDIIAPGPSVLYDDFTAADLNADYVQFSQDGNKIGGAWRNVITREAYDDLFFLVRDADGNVYKVQFLEMLSDTGQRGNASLKYELL